LLYGLQDIVVAKGLIANNENPDQQRIELHKLNCMTAFAEAQTCRRQVLLNYFDETLEEACGNCDICLNPPETYDGTQEAQKALSCVYRLRENYGVNYVIDVLRGKEEERIKRLGHDRLSTYGIGKALSQEEWHSLFRQLIHLGYLEQDLAHYSVLRLTSQAKSILKGEKSLILAKSRVKYRAPKKEKAEKIKKTERSTKTPASELNYDKTLFEKLRRLRKSLALEANVAPFIIFSDVSLIEMSTYLPSTHEEFLAITGVGQKKLESFGKIFLEAIEESQQSN